MPTLDQPPQRPADPAPENPPSVPNLIARIDPWVIYHLKTTILSNVHYENQLYGVLNLFHISIFPLQRRFMTIPQALLRRVVDEDQIDDYLGDVSFGSTGGFHESRDLPGMEVERMIPDFLTVKVKLHHSPPREHCIVALMEVKRNLETTLVQALRQTAEYLRRALKHSHDPELCAYLVMGQMVYRIRASVEGVITEDPPFDMFTIGDILTRELCESAIRNWN